MYWQFYKHIRVANLWNKNGMNDEGEKSLELQAQMENLFNKLGVSV